MDMRSICVWLLIAAAAPAVVRADEQPPAPATVDVGDLWREFRNRRQVGGFVGLTGTPDQSGDRIREQGLTRNGSVELRARVIELAWGWLRYQPASALSQWYRQRYGGGNARLRRIGIVAVARRLLIELWRYAMGGPPPAGAHLKDDAMVA